jgi:hypothetical protein
MGNREYFTDPESEIYPQFTSQMNFTMSTDKEFQDTFHKRINDLSTSQEVPCYFLTAVTGGGMVLLTLVESETNSLYKVGVVFGYQ